LVTATRIPLHDVMGQNQRRLDGQAAQQPWSRHRSDCGRGLVL